METTKTFQWYWKGSTQWLLRITFLNMLPDLEPKEDTIKCWYIAIRYWYYLLYLRTLNTICSQADFCLRSFYDVTLGFQSENNKKGRNQKKGHGGGTIVNLLLQIFKFSRNGRALVILLGQPGILVTAGLDTRGWSAWALFQKFPKETFLRIILFTKLSFPREQSLDFCQPDLSYFWVVYLYFPCKIPDFLFYN